MKAMTYNIRHGLGNDGAVNLERIAAIIRAQQPDIVALQEVDRHWERSGSVDQPAMLSRLLDMEYCFGPNLLQPSDHPNGNAREYGTLILSRFPIVSWSNSPFPPREGREPRGFLNARIDIPGLGEVRCIDTHLQVGKPGIERESAIQRHEQAHILWGVVAASVIPVLMMGDFNAQPGDPELEPLAERLSDAWRMGGDGSDGYTIPTRQDGPGDTRIDAIFVSPDIHVSDCFIIIDERTRIASDHYPVVANLRAARPPATVEDHPFPESRNA